MLLRLTLLPRQSGWVNFGTVHAALLMVCDGVIDVLSPAVVSIEDHLNNVPRCFTEVIRHAVRRGATLAWRPLHSGAARTFAT